jgi:uncharacterized protein DUF3987
MREAVPFLEKSMVPRSPDTVTMPRMIQHMSECQQFTSTGIEITPYLIWAEELPSFLGMDAYKSGKLADLTTLFDCAPVWQSQTKNNGQYEIVNPYVCMLAGSTPSGIYDVMPPASVGQGFTSRVIFIWADEYTRRVPIKPWTEDHIRMSAELANGIEQISKIEGAFKFDMYAETMWSDYYMFRPDPTKEYQDSRLQGFASRIPFYAMKLALLMKLSERTPGNVIEVHHIEKAVQLLEDVIKGLKSVYEEIAPSNVVRHYARVVKYMAEKGGIQIAHSDILKRFSRDLHRRDFAEVMGMLIEMGAVVGEQKIENGHHKMLYSLTKKFKEVLK